MNSYRHFLAVGATTLAVAVCLIVTSTAVLSQTNTGAQPPAAEDMAARQNAMRERVQTHLDRLAKRLEISASQQNAWNAYSTQVTAMIGTGHARPTADTDAASLIRFRAGRASQHAQKLEQLADATATFQQALNPEQRKILDDVVRRRMAFGDHRRHGSLERS